ncbi:MAG TPA: DUF3500 domain-containing protein [Gemmatimonadaceae bacterium]|nr:DUF3500 domain-containing protein [Gemmatimonadaceae bacterium]
MSHRLFLPVILGLGALMLSCAPAPREQAPAATASSVFRPTAASEPLDEPFRGITTDGTIRPGLFGIRSTGVSTEPVRVAAEAFLAGLTEAQRRATHFAADDDEWRMWDNRSRPPRQGTSFKDMTGEQRELAFGLLRAGLSAKGLRTSRDIMRLNETIAEITNNWEAYGEWLYFLTVMGAPSPTEPWGWQLDGHHLIVNYFVLGDQVVMTPTFMGSEPVVAASGKYAGTSVLQVEQDKGVAMMRALSEAQQARARIASAKGPTNNLTEAYRDNVVLDHAGIRATELDARQRRQLVDLIGEYVANMKEGHARVRMSEVEAHLDATYFGWIGESGDDAVFYYRIHSPVILIEFDHQRPVALPRTEGPTRQHIHTVVRTPNGNDYGKDLLRQHIERHPHHQTRDSAGATHRH